MKKLTKILRNIFGAILMIIGVAGAFIPIFQGWIFFLIGFILIEFKQKEIIEEKILNFISKTKIGKKLADYWYKIKHKNKDTINNKDLNIKNMYKELKDDKTSEDSGENILDKNSRGK